jgi:hypothetical protein
MAKFVCKDGTLAFGTSKINDMCLNNVTIDVTTDVHSYDCMTDAWRGTASGIKSWTATAETAWDSEDGIDLAATIGQSATLTFTSVDGVTMTSVVDTGCIVESASISAPVDGFATVSWSFIGNGAISETDNP